MLKGSFGEATGRPHIVARVDITPLRVSGLVSFLIDTGDDQTVLMPRDARRLGVDHSALTKTTTSAGVGGSSVDYITDANVVFTDKVFHIYRTPLIVMAPREGAEKFPSLLGRNILNRWRLVLDYPKKVLTARVNHVRS